MLGHVVRKFLISRDLEVWATSRNISNDEIQNNRMIYLDARGAISNNLKNEDTFEFVINCIGIIKPNIDESNSKSILNAIEVNSRFPHLISTYFANSKIVQIATDCVYSGSIGHYNEKSLHDPTDVYGKTKSLGEVVSPNFVNLRTSIIGREFSTNKSLWNWITNQDKKSELNGFTDHIWNGITTLAFAKIIYGIIDTKLFLPNTQHVLPAGTISKDNLIRAIVQSEGRSDILVKSVKSPMSINRTLSTLDEKLNQKLWSSAGYNEVPTVEFLVNEFSSWYQ